MAPLAHKHHRRMPSLDQAGVVRKVLRQDGEWVCSICRSNYPDQPDAVSCLQRCWREYLALPPVITRGAFKRYTHRCRFCARDYDNFSTATTCAEQCRSELIAKNERDLQALKAPLPEPPKRKNSLRKPMPRLVAVAALNRTSRPAKTNAVGNGPEPIIADAQPQTTKLEPEAKAPVYDDPAATPTKKKPDGKFYRDNAKYACSVCNERYFTKVEVEACYDAHP